MIITIIVVATFKNSTKLSNAYGYDLGSKRSRARIDCF